MFPKKKNQRKLIQKIRLDVSLQGFHTCCVRWQVLETIFDFSMNAIDNENSNENEKTKKASR